jgi:hypothetical protein
MSDSFRKFNHEKYTYTKRHHWHVHYWQTVGPVGAVHYRAQIHQDNEYEPSCGLEMHHSALVRERFGYDDEAPHHLDCELTGGPCWHDGTSSYASDLWPMIEADLMMNNHEGVFMTLRREYRDRFDGGEE